MLSPAPAEPPKSFALGRSLRRGQLWEDSPGGTAGVTPTSWWRWDVAQGWQRLCVVPRPQRRAGGLASPPPPPGTWDQGSFGVIRDLPRCEGWGHLWVRGTRWARTGSLALAGGKAGHVEGGTLTQQPGPCTP